MKRWIHASKNIGIDSVSFASNLVHNLKQILPKKCWPHANSKYDEIIVEQMSERDTKKLHDALIKALNKMNYKVYDIAGKDDEGYDIAAADGDAFVKLVTNVGDYFGNPTMGYIDIDYNTGNIIFEDWYEE